ncbi:Pyranose dehydrogenase 3 [Cladobotryum mycophilum]|uniref:Pyranose dehydrogenase 3 n=1 Tax=Cladobotryum mycophilum TaxID=491253 RepID=A0ABR0SJE1_9HYPO
MIDAWNKIINAKADEMVAHETFDFICAGGGTAGLLVAGRLASNPDVSVLVVEAGKDNHENAQGILTPALAFDLPESEYDWAYETTIVDKEGYKRVEKKNTAGKVLGGSSCLNHCAWLQGSKATYDEWQDFGGSEWSWENCAEYFKKPVSFNNEDELMGNELQKAVANSSRSLLEISPIQPTPLADPITKAWTSRGYAIARDTLDGQVDGLSHTVQTIHHGQRSTSTCFIKDKENVTVLSSSLVEKVVFENRTAIGVMVSDLGANQRFYKAKREVIISCGVFESPKLLMLSGIGPREQFFKLRLPYLAASPHVGKNLQDHPTLSHTFRVSDGYSMDPIMRPGLERDEAMKMYHEKRTGPMGSGLVEMTAFTRIDARLQTCREWRNMVEADPHLDPLGPHQQPHCKFDFMPFFASPFQPHVKQPKEGSYLTVVSSLLRPKSRGTVCLKSTDISQQPVINLNHLAEEVDVASLREGMRFIHEVLMKGDGMRDLIFGEHPEPLPESDKDFNDLISRQVTTGYDACGTCRMGNDIMNGVVDSHLRVFGANNLRVIDASVFPIIPDASIQSAVYMVAEKGTQMIMKDYPDLWEMGNKETNGVYALISTVRHIVSGNKDLWHKARGC